MSLAKLSTLNVLGIEVACWDPQVPSTGTGRTKPFASLGDLLGPQLVARMVRSRTDRIPSSGAPTAARLLTTGANLNLAVDGDVVWGAALDSRVGLEAAPSLDVRGVRGPLTAARLAELGHACAAVIGDPAFLAPTYFPEITWAAGTRQRALAYVPDLDDTPVAELLPHLVPARGSLLRTMRSIVQSDLVIGSSLAAIVVADAFGVPARAIASGAAQSADLDDYFAATGRAGTEIAPDAHTALQMGGHDAPVVDVAVLEDSFPVDLWRGTHDEERA